jgi:hypothetical protein
MVVAILPRATTIMQLQKQQLHQPVIPNNNSISPSSLPSNWNGPSSSLPQTGLSAIHNQAVP